MSTPQNTIAIVYDYDQTLSPSYMQDEVVFPAFGIDGAKFWRRCTELVREHGYDNELAYMKVLLDSSGMDRPTNDELKEMGRKLNFYKGLPEMFDEFANGLLTRRAASPRDHGRALHHFVRHEGPDRWQPACGHMSARFSAANLMRTSRAESHFRSA